jgi:hypothetical protein
MAERIADRTAKLKQEMKPVTELEGVLVTQFARASVQAEVAEELIDLNVEMVRASLDDDETWENDRTQEINKKAARIGRDPYNVQRALLQTKQGVEWLLYHWGMLGQMIRCNSGLDDTQRQLCFDLLGIPESGRAGTETVPAGDDAAGLHTLVTRQKQQLESRLKLVLEKRDLWARKKVRLGLRTPPDPDTRNLKSDRSRAYRRMTWALDTFRAVRAGTLTGPIIDPETKKPLAGAHGGNGAAGAGTVAQASGKAEVVRGAPAPHWQSAGEAEAPGDATTPTPGAPGPSSRGERGADGDEPATGGPETRPDDDKPVPVPDNLKKQEDREAFIVAGELLRALVRSGDLKLPPHVRPAT